MDRHAKLTVKALTHSSSTKRLAMHLAEFFPSKVTQSLEFVAMNLKIWQRTDSLFTHSFRVKYVVGLTTKVVLDLIELFASTV